MNRTIVSLAVVSFLFVGGCGGAASAAATSPGTATAAPVSVDAMTTVRGGSQATAENSCTKVRKVCPAEL
jgi:uncharacterized protein YceK